MGKAILTPIDNPEKVVKASNSLMSDGTTNVESAIGTINTSMTKNGLAGGVSITSYSSANRYTIPNDGYVNLNNTSSQTATIRVYGSSGSGNMYVGGVGGSHAVFVRKGMKVWIEGTCSSAYFVALT